MPYDVTSSFIARSRQRTPDVVRQFTIASSDYSSRVLQWPKFSRVWDEIRPRTLRIQLANGDQGMNFLRDDKTLLENQATIKMGFGDVDTELIINGRFDDNIDNWAVVGNGVISYDAGTLKVTIQSPEFITNGTFDTDSDWVKGTGWTISGGVAHHADGSQSFLTQTIAMIIGVTYTLIYTVSNYVSGTIRAQLEGISGSNQSGNGTFTTDAIATVDNGDFELLASATFVGDIDNVSVKRTQISGGAEQTITTEIGKTYTVALDITSSVVINSGRFGAGTLSNSLNLFDSGIGQGVTNYSFTFVATTTITFITILLQGDDIETINYDNISVKQFETIDLFMGKMRGVAYSDEKCTISIVDKFQQLSERKIGASDATVDYVGSNYLPSDIAWWAVTSFGGYDTAANSNNVDIDFESFENWAAIFSGDSVFINATFNGQKCTEVLRKIARHTHSAIFIKENKLSFHRFGIADANVSSMGPDDILDMKLSFDTNDITNKQFVSGDYDVTSKYHKFTVFDQDTPSVNSFGLKERVLKDDNVWYVNSASAINLAQRLIIANAAPEDSVKIRAGLVGLPRLIGETITVLDAFHGLEESYRILEHTIDMDKGITEFRIDRTQFSNQFILNTSLLNGDDVLT